MKALELRQQNVLDEMVWDPRVDSANIAVTVPQQGVVRLSRMPAANTPADEKIEKAAIDALRLRTAVPRDSVTVTVEDGYLTLSGRVSWFYQRRAAANAVRFLPGVRGVVNLLEVDAKPSRTEPHRVLIHNSR